MGLFWLATAWYMAWKKSWFSLARFASVGTVVVTLLAGHLDELSVLRTGSGIQPLQYASSRGGFKKAFPI